MIMLLLTAALRALVIGSLAGTALRIFQVQHPVYRKAVWAVVLVVGFAMPFLQAHSAFFSFPRFSHSASQRWPGSVSVELSKMSSASGELLQFAKPDADRRPLFSLQALMLITYVLVAGVLLLRIAAGVVTARGLFLRSRPLDAMHDRSIRISDEVVTPWTFGSSIILPHHALGWSEEQVKLVLAHEVSHVQQGDFYLQLAARLYTAVFWFSPLGWWLQRECERLGEQTSDRAALSISSESSTYVSLLLRFSTASTLPGVCMARASGVRRRIDSILASGSIERYFERPRRAAALALIVALLSVTAGSVSLEGQSGGEQEGVARPTVPFQTFDVISVKPNKSGTENMGLRSDETTLHATNVSIPMLMMNAYGVSTTSISNLPKWAENMHYDLDAKISEPNPAFKERTLSRSEGEAIWHARMQAILIERFHIKMHYETVPGPVYDLVLIHDGRKLEVSKVPASQEGMSMNSNSLTALHLPIKSLCAGLESAVQRHVIDKTGLTGIYDIKLFWTPEEQADSAKESGTSNPPPDIFTALQEQLGLKLVPAKGPVRRLVVDSIEAPATN